MYVGEYDFNIITCVLVILLLITKIQKCHIWSFDGIVRLLSYQIKFKLQAFVGKIFINRKNYS